MRRLSRVTKWYLFREPNRDFSIWIYLVVGSLSVLTAASRWFGGLMGPPTDTYSTVSFLIAGLTFIMAGVTESLPARWRKSVAALRVTQLVLIVLFVVVFVLTILSWRQA
jgi:hypothetical protein